MEDVLSRSIKSIVAEDFRTARIFEKYSLDFCCKGGQTLDAACTSKGINPALLTKELEVLKSEAPRNNFRPESWDLDVLADYIVANHHSYVKQSLPTLTAHVRKIAAVHGENHPELIDIARRFTSVAEELTHHMEKEEAILFPYIRTLAGSARANLRVSPPPFRTIANPINMMEAEHASAGDNLSFIRTATSGYTLPEDACSTYRVTFGELEEFELDLHQHVHLENNILFPKAVELEKKILALS